MTQDKTGGPAFPAQPKYETPGAGFLEHNQGGMTLRDYAVIQLIAGMLAHPTRYKQRPQDANLYWHDAIATEAGEIADAMLKQREGG